MTYSNEHQLNQAYVECQQEAIDAGALKPQGIWERIAANIISFNGGFWENTPLAQQRLHDWTYECMRRRGFQV